MAHKLGRKPPDYSKHRLWTEDYYKTSLLPHTQAVVDYATGVQFPMYLNDQYGDCTIAGIGHLYGSTSYFAQQKAEREFSTDTILQTYERNCPGFNPNGDVNDNGCTLQGVLQDQTGNGMVDTNGNVNSVSAFAQMKGMGPRDLNVALQLYGAVYCGVNLPQSAEDQFPKPWTYVKGSPIIGGHCIVLAKNELWAEYPYYFVTWGAVVQASQEWVSTYLEEAWVALTPDWLNANGTTLSGVDVTALKADMNAKNL